MAQPPPPTVIDKPDEIGRLQATFQDKDFSAHGSTWDALWKDAYTPWDRQGPSMALNDVLMAAAQDDDPAAAGLFPALHSSHDTTAAAKRPKALVPGCGRGHDVLLLSAFGYDVTGLDTSATALREAAENARATGDDPVYVPRVGIAAAKGSLTWLVADFFDSAWSSDLVAAEGGYDLIFDYTFFVALPIEARPKWAKRMAELLKPGTGRLVCLEWPLTKPPSTGGPPWGVTADAYAAHLGHPGEEIPYNKDGYVAVAAPSSSSSAGLKQLGRFKPTRTHKAGYDADGRITDFISVWGRP
ncbi:S-adenosyl-L-methionine-dependent methyltransferase [Podospora appendiculata]|uniref:S-adenosyl-L-methionine-dependent methyltransferase n=1 Tax=Podospora appendiculata TaxID=314037 RepID=A0AAE1CAE6_9PEZI|nr:S-adenosyl-L-methionine-dependent methyltransferase [Podospora appendiculata]